MKFTIAAIHCIIDKDSNQVILDPDNIKTEVILFFNTFSNFEDREQFHQSNSYLFQNARATFTYVFDSIKKDIVCCHTSGIFSEKELVQTKERCRDASQYVFDFYREVVKKYANII